MGKGLLKQEQMGKGLWKQDQMGKGLWKQDQMGKRLFNSYRTLMMTNLPKAHQVNIPMTCFRMIELLLDNGEPKSTVTVGGWETRHHGWMETPWGKTRHAILGEIYC